MIRVSRPATLALIGPMGAGKTQVGRKVAKLLGRRFRDVDRMVERSEGRTIAQIFAQEGETYFRARESEAVGAALRSAGAVIACGGGIVLNPQNVLQLKASGPVVYLKPSLEKAAERVRSGQGRPLLQNGDPRENLSRLMQERDELYRAAADFTVESDGSVEEVAAAVLKVLGKKARPAPVPGTSAEPA